MRGLWTNIGLFGFAAATLFLVADSQARSAARPSTQRSNNGAMAQTGRIRGRSAAMTHQEIAALRTAHQLLAQAKHDYEGHRAKAMHEIHQAIHAMLPNHAKPANGNTTAKGAGSTPNGTTGAGTPPNGTKGAGNTTNGTKTPNQGAGGTGAAGKETQAQSDALLKKAQQILQTVHGQMGGKHHAKAKGLVQAAIQHLNTALEIR